MKKRHSSIYTICLLVAILCASCGNHQAQKPPEADALTSFAVFLRNFTSDADYQMAHIRFPLGTISGVFQANQPAAFTQELWALRALDDFEIDSEYEEGGFTEISPEEVTFSCQGNVIGYFRSCTFKRIDGEWYLTHADESGSDLSPYEEAKAQVANWNAEYVKRHQAKAVFVPYTSVGIDGDYPETSQRILTEEELATKSRREMRLMRNEIFARHGYIFNKPDLRRHFLEQPWYAPLFHQVEARLTDTERANIKLLTSLEKGFPKKI